MRLVPTIVPRLRLGLRTAAAAAWADRPVRGAVAAAVVTFVGLQLLLAAWVHFAFAGQYHGPFLMKAGFGVTTAEAAHGIRPVVFSHGHNGWDGQFYYRASTDLLGRAADVPAHFDNVTYRYQRIGMPLVAAAASKLLGKSFTSPRVYLSVQNLLAAVGVGAVVFFLLRHGVSPWFAALWVFASGTVYTLFFGLPDAACDAVFAVAFVALWYRRPVVYAAAATLLVLGREGYALFPFAVFVGTALGRVRWGEWGRVRAAVVTALPGVVLVAWTVYLAEHFGVPLTQKDRTDPNIYGRPFVACWRTLLEAAHWGLSEAVFHRVVTVATIVTVFATAARHARRAEFACVLPYIVLTTCTGPVVWWDQSGFFKLLGTPILVGLFLLPFAPSVWLRAVLVANAVMGVEWNACRGLLPAPFFSDRGTAFVNGPQPTLPFNPVIGDPRNLPPLPDRPFNAPLPEHRYKLEWRDGGPELAAAYQGAWRWAHRELVPLRVAVTNEGQVPWQPNPRLGHGAVNVAYYLTDKDGTTVLLDGRTPLPAAVPPGQTAELTVDLRLPPPGRYRLYLAVVQDGIHWVDPLKPSHGLYQALRVR